MESLLQQWHDKSQLTPDEAKILSEFSDILNLNEEQEPENKIVEKEEVELPFK